MAKSPLGMRHSPLGMEYPPLRMGYSPLGMTHPAFGADGPLFGMAYQLPGMVGSRFGMRLTLLGTGHPFLGMDRPFRSIGNPENRLENEGYEHFMVSMMVLQAHWRVVEVHWWMCRFYWDLGGLEGSHNRQRSEPSRSLQNVPHRFTSGGSIRHPVAFGEIFLFRDFFRPSGDPPPLEIRERIPSGDSEPLCGYKASS